MNKIKFNFDNSYIQLSEALYTRLDPVKVSDPNTILVNKDLMSELGLDFSGIDESQLAALFSGNFVPEGSQPIATAYAGHQFGHFTILGDGRAHLMGEHVAPDGKRFDIQLKGSGRTPYARRGDGRAALGPMLREYIISQAMHALGIPTTRSLAVVTTGEVVMREEPLVGAVLTRVASSHIRIGTFEYIANTQDITLLEKLLDYTINRHYPELINDDNKAISLIKALIEKQSDLITHWMRVGFIHGVMNTDNMTLSAETIDYGPCAFMDNYDPQTVFSAIDTRGRYAYGHQPIIAAWNIARLAESLLPFIDPDINKAIKIAEETIMSFQPTYEEKWLTMMRAKLGLSETHPEDKKLISDLLGWMQQNYVDYTVFFRNLSNGEKPAEKIYHSKQFSDWYQKWQNRVALEKSKESAFSLMKQKNPSIIPRNHHVEYILDAANRGNIHPFNDFLSALKNPYDDHHNNTLYCSPPKPNERVFQTFCGT